MSVRQCPTGLLSTCRFVTLVFAAVLVVWPRLTPAHHSFSPLLTADGEETIRVLEGTVRVFKILNPHGALILNVTDETGATEGWLFELSPAAQLAREGWEDDLFLPGDKVTVATLQSSVPNRGRLRAVLMHGGGQEEADRLLVSYGIRGDTPIMRRLRARLPTCGTIEGRLDRTACFSVDAQELHALEEEFPGQMGYVMP